jgi:hypothetical protein
MSGSRSTQSLPPDPARIRHLESATEIDRTLIDTSGWRWAQLQLRRQFSPYYWYGPPAWKVALRALDGRRLAPSFLSLGAARSGTTLFSDYLMQHPCVALPLAKEITISGNQRVVAGQFPHTRQAEAIRKRHGMVLTGYCPPAIPNLIFPGMLSHLTRATDLKFLILLRNPVERTFSHYKWERHLVARRSPGLIDKIPSFREIVELEVEAAQSFATSGALHLTGAGTGGFIQESIALPFLRTLFRHWDRETALVIDSDEFFRSPADVSRRAYRFLGLPDYDPVELPVRNAGVAGDMDSEARRMLHDFFAPLNRELFDFLGEDFGWS